MHDVLHNYLEDVYTAAICSHSFKLDKVESQARKVCTKMWSMQLVDHCKYM